MLLQANPEVVKEMLNMDSSALLEVLNEFGFVSKEELEAEREEARRKLEAERKKTAGKMKGKGFTPDEISDMLDMPLKTIREYLNEEA
ncbi:MAG: hypothetical protein LBU32_04385 [Clostridiales bacterium]|nr:hypothetical protein [Clostridiales bacterium]